MNQTSATYLRAYAELPIVITINVISRQNFIDVILLDMLYFD